MAKTKSRKKKCKGHKKDGTPCGKWAVRGFDVCGSHGAGSPHKGRAGGGVKKQIAWDLEHNPKLKERAEKYLNVENPYDLQQELAMMRGLFEETLSKFHDGHRLTVNDTTALNAIQDGIGRMVERIGKLELMAVDAKKKEAETILTQAIGNLINEFVPMAQRMAAYQAFRKEIGISE